MIDCLEHAERLHICVGGSEWSQEVRVGVTGQHSVNGQVREEVDHVPDMVQPGGLKVSIGDGAVGDAPLRREGEVVP